MINEDKRFLTIKEFCSQARIGRITMHRYMKQGLVPFTKIGYRVLIPASVLTTLEEKALEGKQ